MNFVNSGLRAGVCLQRSNIDRCIAFALLLLFLFLGGCMKQRLPVYYYTMSSSTQSAGTPSGSVPVILVGPVHFVSILDQSLLVTQNSKYSVNLEEQRRWAGDLQEMVVNVLINNLSLALGSDKVYTFPSIHGQNGLQLITNFLHFEKDTNGKAFVEARWKLVSDDGRTIFHTSTSTHTIEPENSTYDALVKALSEGLSRLSNDITKTINTL